MYGNLAGRLDWNMRNINDSALKRNSPSPSPSEDRDSALKSRHPALGSRTLSVLEKKYDYQ